MPDLTCSLRSLHLYPVKSCAGIDLPHSVLLEDGLADDRAWMVVDRGGDMLTQRGHPALALIRPQRTAGAVQLRAPGMLTLHLPLKVEPTLAPTRVRIWNDIVRARELGPLADQWVSDYLGQPAQLVRFDPAERRLADRHWTGRKEAPVRFGDGFPLLVAGSASLAELNRRLTERGRPPVTMDRFRPNLVLDGLEPFDEDHIDELQLPTDEGPVRLRLVKPCVRCSIPNVDPATGEVGLEPGATLAGFRADPRMDGGITFGMNAIVLEGAGRTLRAGLAAEARLAFA